ncbi:phosphatidylglycerophosphatase A [bacterium BMS3Bbin06]|nr:phosphatidylglycerophosphatase A [bacterium BMS3Abin08]GBE34164.1 phosphatidylglycerophosphatase A [bacterium BMS3Bbin06]HDO36374.1 phosphatidylglycerophosphatase A [Nitrospirota bacterium]HDY70143.1 phosphatidylglycerophosphatase A [Nitrospirota bacterium]
MTKDNLLKVLATIGPLGYTPVAPGTAGTLMACLFFVIFRPGDQALLLIIPILFVVGTVSSSKAELLLKEKDSSHIIIDEFVGYLVSVVFIPYSIEVSILSFFIFRLFDIIKPPPIRHIEKGISAGLGIMLDDILAGIYTNIMLRLILIFWK